MKKRRLLFLLLALVVIAVIGVVLLVAFAARGGLQSKKIAANTILEVDLETAIVEYVPQDPFAQILQEQTPTTRGLVEALTRAADDERVVGLIARVGAAPIGVAQLHELGDAVIAFRAAGKKAVAFSETFGEVASGNGSYYLASAFDEIYLQPSGDVNLTGLFLEAQFVRNLLEKLGLEPRFDQRYEYKNAMNTITDTEFTPAFREAMTAIMDSIFEQLVDGIATARGIAPDELRALIDGGPFLGQEAVDAGLVDGLAYRDEVYDRLKGEMGEDAELLFLRTYAKRAGKLYDEGEAIALIYGVGGVVRGGQEFSPLAGSTSMASDKVSAAFRAAIDDDDVRAILFRVDSPGGSYVASDTIYRETLRAKEAGKPVIVSMGNVAGSGGYFVAMAADKIVAQPGTITGSIGVLGGKFLTGGMWEKIGISWDSVQTSEHADMYTGTHDYSESEWARFQDWLDRVYADFTQKVAAGRGMELAEVHEIAKGRIWTGAAAKEIGLVDEVGGFPVALRLAREAAGLEADADIELRLFPRPKTPFQLLFDNKPASSEARAVRALAGVLEEVRPALRAAEHLGVLGDPAERMLALPPELIPQP